MNLGGIFIAEVPKEEDVTFIVIGVAGPALMEGDAIEVGVDGMAHDLDVIEVHAEVLGVLENTAQVGELLLLRLFIVLDLGRRHAVAVALLDHSSRDDEGIFAEDLFQEVDVLLVVGRAETLHIIENHLTTTQVGEFAVLADDLHIEIHGDGEVETLHLARVVEADDSFLVFVFVEFTFSRGFHQQGDIADLIARTGGDAVFDNLLVGTDKGGVLP